MSTATSYLAANLRLSIGYGEKLAADIPAEKFTFKPHPTMNHPAWCFGHLSVYPDRLFVNAFGRPDLAKTNEQFEKLFAAGTECLADPKVYPSKEEIMAHFVGRYKAMADLLPSVTDATLEEVNPNEKMRERMPKKGNAVFFLCANHIMMHLGQVSSWRRAAGLPGVM